MAIDGGGAPRLQRCAGAWMDWPEADRRVASLDLDAAIDARDDVAIIAWAKRHHDKLRALLNT